MRSFGRPLKADTVTGDVSSRPRKARDEAAADRIGKEPENDGNGARLLQQLRSGGRALRKNEVRLQRDEFLGELFINSLSSAVQRVSIRTLRPSVHPSF